MKIQIAAAAFLSIVNMASADFLYDLLSLGTNFPQKAVTGLDYSVDQEVSEVHFSFDAAFDTDGYEPSRKLEAGEEPKEEPKAEEQPRQLQEEDGADGGHYSNTGTITTGFAAGEDVSDISLDVKIYYPDDSYYSEGARNLRGNAEQKTE